MTPRAQATVEALREQLRLANIDQANAEARANNAQQQVEALQRERDKLREATKVICGHCCEPMAIPSKAILQSQLSALQGLVRVYFTEPDPHTWTAAYQTLKRMGRALPATPTERGQG